MFSLFLMGSDSHAFPAEESRRLLFHQSLNKACREDLRQAIDLNSKTNPFDLADELWVDSEEKVDSYLLLKDSTQSVSKIFIPSHWVPHCELKFTPALIKFIKKQTLTTSGGVLQKPKKNRTRKGRDSLSKRRPSGTFAKSN